MKTTIVNLFGGPGTGKSTLAAGIVHELKKRGFEAILVHEEYKAAALSSQRPTIAEEIDIVNSQIQHELRFYGLADFIVTDSPLELNAFYSDRLRFDDTCGPWFNLIEKVREDTPIVRHDFLVQRTIEFADDGRFEDADEARQIDRELELYLRDIWYYRPEKIGVCPNLATDHILVGRSWQEEHMTGVEPQ